MKKKPFTPVPPQTDFVKNEHRLLKQWRQSGLLKKYLNKNKGAKKRFSFIDGPITANNPMGVHHAWGRTLKDIYQRYKNMRGFAQRFQNGFDCQGLWVEVEVEKEKGFRSKKEIENYGIGRFVNACQARVNKYAQIQTRQSIRLGYFMDWDHSYFTMSEENNYAIWRFLQRCHQKESIYKGDDAVPWCPRCGTSISQQEVAEGGYRLTTHQAVFMRLPVIKGKNQEALKAAGPDSSEVEKNEFLLVWTTTPWTIPANTLVAAHPQIKYALVEFEDKKYWLAANLINQIFGKNLKPIRMVSGKDLIEKEKITHYQAPFDDLPVIQKVSRSPRFHRLVLAKNLVNEKEGAGLVHVVPGAGGEDYRLVKKELGWEEVVFPVVDEEGSYVKGYGRLAGKNAKKHPEIIIDYLQKKTGRFLFKTESHRHSYPICWRCKTELIWRLVDEWYINMDQDWGGGVSLRQRMMKITRQIDWRPRFGLKRELDWLNNMADWMISKKRYWGLALPIWECQNGHFTVIGSWEELKKRAVTGWDKFAGHTPHRPWIDRVKIKCPECDQEMSRTPDVGNPWLDAGIVPFSTLIDPKTKKPSYLGDKKYWRKWYPADFITESFPGQFRNWFYSLIAMAAGLENKPSFKTVLGYALVRDEKGEEMHKSTGNAIWFDEGAEKIGVDTMRWLYARQDPKANLNFGYRVADEVRRQQILLFFNTYRFFITYANLNNFRPAKNPWPKKPGVLDQWLLSRLESTKQTAAEKLDGWAHQEAMAVVEEFLADLSRWYVRRSRERVSPDNLNAKDRNACLNTLYYALKQLSLMLAPFIPFLTETIWQNLTGDGSVHLQNWPKVNKKAINRQLEKEMAAAREVVELGHAERKQKEIGVRQPLQKLKVKNENLKINEEIISLIRDELNVKEVLIRPGKGKLEVELETKLTPSLIAEGQARRLIRQVQVLRREKELALGDRIKITAPAWPEEWEETIRQKTGAVAIKKGKRLKIRRA